MSSFFKDCVEPPLTIVGILLVTLIVYKIIPHENMLYGQDIYALVSVPGFLFLIYNFRSHIIYGELELEVVGFVLVLSAISPYIPIYVPFDVVPLIRVILGVMS